jgi:hypothetical protein
MRRHVTNPHLLRRSIFVLAAGCVLTLMSCNSTEPEPEPGPDDPFTNFDALWTDFDRSYALFGIYPANWDSLGKAHRDRLPDQPDPERTLAVMCDLLAELGDGRARIVEPKSRCITDPVDTLAWFVDGAPAEFWADYQATRQLIAERYLADADTASSTNWISDVQSQDKRLLYLELDSFDDQDGRVVWAELEALFAAAPECDGLVIDIRGNAGGQDERVLMVANALAVSPRDYFHRQRRDGLAHDDLTAPQAVPATPFLTGWGEVPVAVLSHGYTSEAAERFLLAMRACPNTTIVGTPTRGALSTPDHRTLPGGWVYAICDELVRDTDGVCWEGVGVPPHYNVYNTTEAAAQGRDLVLEIAVTLLLLRVGS